MRDNVYTKVGKFLMEHGNLRICIVDDQKTYFSDNMIQVANSAGFQNIERYFIVDKQLMKTLLENPPDIIILDIKGIAEEEVSKDGFGIARVLYDNTNTFVVITSAHKFFLHETHKSYDYMMKERLLTTVDFVEELGLIIDRYLRLKSRIYKKMIFRIGFSMVKKAIVHNL
jgi:two-component SAPR family response regulator